MVLTDYELRYAERALDAMGFATEAEVADYFRLRRPGAREALAQLQQQGLVHEVMVPGEREIHYVRTCDLPPPSANMDILLCRSLSRAGWSARSI